VTKAVAIALLLAATAARAGVAPLELGNGAPAKLGAASLSATACTLDGPPLTFHMRLAERHDLVRAPSGDLVLLDDDNHLRRYRPKRGKGCAFAIDKTFGKNGVLDLGLGSSDKVYAHLAVDADGTVYVSNVPHQPWRVHGGKADAMCGDATRVNASPRSKVVWRYQEYTEATRERGDCSDASSAYLHGFEIGASQLWVVDDRAVATGGEDGDQKTIFVVLGADGQAAGRLEVPAELSLQAPERIARCGGAICAFAYDHLALWDDAGALIGIADLQALIGAKGFIVTYDLAPGDGEAYLLVRANDVEHSDDLQQGAIVRIDGFPR
jgi:hypothetical protein